MSEAMPDDPTLLLQRELRPGEELVWTGVPDPKVVERNYRLGRNVELGVVVAAMIWIAGVLIVNEIWWHLPLMRLAIWAGIPFVGWVFLLNETIGSARRMKRTTAETIYGLTRERAIVIEGLCGRMEVRRCTGLTRSI